MLSGKFSYEDMVQKKKKVKRTTLKAKADKLFRDIVRSRGECQLRGLDHVACDDELQTMHIVGRGNYRLRWEEENALCGCSGHHFYYTNNPYFWGILIQEKFPEKHAFIMQHKNEYWDKDYEKVLGLLQQRYDQILGN